MLFKDLAHYFHDIEETSSRNDMTELLAKLFDEIDADLVDKVVYMLQGRVKAQYVKADFGLGEKMIIKAVIRALNIDSKKFRDKVSDEGDIGLATENLKHDIRSFTERDYTVTEVYEKLLSISKQSGEGSQDDKMGILADLVQSLDPLSARYVVRIPAQTLRLGFSDMTILDALSWMLKGDKSARKEIEKAYHVRPDLGHLAHVLKKEGLSGISSMSPSIGTPILMMKAQRLPTPKDICDKLGTGIIEPKYDGFRLQAHYRRAGKGAEVVLFSRGLEDVTHMYPDVVEGIKNEVTASSVIIEGEAIGFDEYSGNFLPFQKTVQRKRKYDIEEMAEKIPLKMFAFDLLYLEGESYLDRPLKDRVNALRDNTQTKGDIFKDTLLIAEENTMKSEKDVEEAFDKAIERGLEGIMIKKEDAPYTPGARGWSWIKYKRSYSTKIEDTIDCLVMGYDKGKGKRAGFGIGAFLAGVYDSENDVFKTVAKIGTGLSDEEWKQLHERGQKLSSDTKPALYEPGKDISVNVWMKPEVVVEIKADEITKSPSHSAGLALRFPRLEHFRDDKKPEDVTSLQEVTAMYEAQTSDNQSSSRKKK